MKIKIVAFISIDHSIQSVYEMAEQYPQFVSFYDLKVIEENTPTSNKVRSGMKLIGFIPVRWRGEGVKVKDCSIKYIQTEGLLKGLTSDWEFFKINPVLTKVQISLLFNSFFFVAWILRFFLKNITEQLLNDFRFAFKSGKIR